MRWGRVPTAEERGLARYALRVLEQERLVVKLAPAPRQSFDGHMIRVVECRNPQWYRDLFASRRSGVKRCRIIRALRRVLEGKMDGYGYEKELLDLFKELRRDYARRQSQRV